MKLEGEQLLLRVHTRNTAGYGLTNVAEALVERAHQRGLAGATVLRGICGLDVTGAFLEVGVLGLSEQVPVLVEIVDSAANVMPFLADVREITQDAIVTLERAHVLIYRASRSSAARAAQHLRVPAPVKDLSTVPTSEEYPIMKMSEEGQLLRVFIGEDDVWQGQPLYRTIVLKVRELGMAGATVLRGPMGYGANSRVHSTGLLDLSSELPVIVEVVESAEKVQTLLPFLDQVVKEGLITLESVRILRYRHGQAKAGR